MQRLYCYVDESGQDTQARSSREAFFIVSVVVTAKNAEELERRCLRYEKASNKVLKWSKTKREYAYHFIRLVFADQQFRESLRFTVHEPTDDKPFIDFDRATAVTILKVITVSVSRLGISFDDYTADVFIDGISKTQQWVYKNWLKGRHCNVRSVHRARDESYALIRLADAVAGLVRDFREGNEEAGQLLAHGRRYGIVLEI
jgi:hypothetical protein